MQRACHSAGTLLASSLSDCIAAEVVKPPEESDRGARHRGKELYPEE